MTKDAMLQKKSTTSSKGNITLGPILVTKGRSEPNLTTNLNDQIGKGGKGETKAKVGTGGGEKERIETTKTRVKHL
jgi:hypothetical protein